MADAYKGGHLHGQNGGQVPPQGMTPAAVYKPFVAGVIDGQNSRK